MWAPGKRVDRSSPGSRVQTFFTGSPFHFLWIGRVFGVRLAAWCLSWGPSRANGSPMVGRWSVDPKVRKGCANGDGDGSDGWRDKCGASDGKTLRSEMERELGNLETVGEVKGLGSIYCNRLDCPLGRLRFPGSWQGGLATWYTAYTILVVGR